MGLLNALTQAAANYGDDVIRNTVNQYGDDILRSVANQTDDYADDLIMNAFNNINNYKTKNGAKLIDRGFDHFGTHDFDYAKLMRDSEKAISNAVGDDALTALRKNVSGMLEMFPTDYRKALNTAKGYLNDTASDSIARESQKYVKPGTKIYRAANSPFGISWTTDKNVALQARNNDNVRILEHILQPEEKYIAPQFTELYNQFTAPQYEVLFNDDIFRK